MLRRPRYEKAFSGVRFGAVLAAPALLVAALLCNGDTCGSGRGDQHWHGWLIPSAIAKDKKESKSSERSESSKKSSSDDKRESSEKSESYSKEKSDSSRESSDDHDDDGGRDESSRSYSGLKDTDSSDADAGKESVNSNSWKSEDRRIGNSRTPHTVKELLERAFEDNGAGKETAKPGAAAAGASAASKQGRRSGAEAIKPLAPIGGRSYVNDEILAVDLSPQGAARARKLGFTVHGAQHTPSGQSVTRLKTPGGIGALKARDMLTNSAPDERISLNQVYRPYHVANKDMSSEASQTVPATRGGLAACTVDHCFPRQLIRWHDAVQPCAKSLRVGVIDTQFDVQHPAFSKAALHVGGFVPEGRQSASDWHGTGVLALLAGDPDSGTPGLIPHADFYVASIFFQDSAGEVATDTVSVLGALEWMNAFDVKVINMSFSGPKDPLVEKAIAEMSARGVVFVAAAGNDGPASEPAFPAAYKPVVAVTAVNKDLRNYPYANRGERIDVAAPGVNIWSAVPAAREGFHTGTSFAAPYVTAILATLYNGLPVTSKDEVLNRLAIMDLGPAGRDPIYGRGLVLAPAKCSVADGAIAQVPVQQQQQPRNTQLPPVGWGASITADETSALR